MEILPYNHLLHILVSVENQLFHHFLKEKKKCCVYLKISPSQEKDFNRVFALAIQKASNRLNEECNPKPRKFIHLYCGRSFPTRGAAQEHAEKGECRASKQTMKARQKKLTIQKRNS